jgi:hypothetical protein
VISVLIPTRQRPGRLRETIKSINETTFIVPEILCYVSDCDRSYEQETGFYYAKFIRGPRVTFSDLWNQLIPHATNDILMLCADDVIFRTPNWDLDIERAFAAVPDRILLAYGDDGGPNGKRFASLPFVSRRWVETVGYFTPPGFSADYSDTWPNDVAEMIGRKQFVNVLIEHMHHVWGKAEKDKTYQENEERWHRDRPDLTYMNRLPERQRDADKLRAAMSG